VIAMRIVLEDTATPALERVRGFLQSGEAQSVIGYTGRNVVREHLQELEETRSGASGGPATHYYGSARRATSWYPAGDNAVEINVAQVGMRLHFYGGTVEAGKGISSATGAPTKYLTIPATPEAHGRKASDFDLVLVWANGRPVALALAESTESMTARGGFKATRKAGKIMFTLKESVTLAPDPSVMPTTEDFSEAIVERLGSVIRRRFHGEVSAAGDEGEAHE
jgi:hypothetical protein